MSNYIIKSAITIVGGFGALYAINREFKKASLKKQHFNEIYAKNIYSIYEDDDYKISSVNIFGIDGKHISIDTKYWMHLDEKDGPKKVYYSDDLKYVAYSKEYLMKLQMGLSCFTFS